jgi:MFS family permease
MINIFFLGLVSFFTDISTEMVYPLIPLFLNLEFGTGPALIGIIEGIAESLASVLKVYSGYLSDRFQKKKALAFAGYATGLLYKLVLLIASSWAWVLCARVLDRLGKGIRTAPRDVLVSESADASKMGNAFGLHKALDMAGSALGILITWCVLREMSAFSSDGLYGEAQILAIAGIGNSVDYREIFMISVIPAVMGLCMFFFIKQKEGRRKPQQRLAFWQNFRTINTQLQIYLFVVFLFTLGNSSNAFLLLKAFHIGFDKTDTILLYFIYNAVASVLSIPFGRLSDRAGRKKLLVPGYFLFSVCYLGFAFASTQALMLCAFIVYGVFTAMITGVERAYVAEIAPPALKGTMLGLQSTVVGIALFPASVITGFLWESFGDAIPFAFGAILAFAAAMILLLCMRKPTQSLSA